MHATIDAYLDSLKTALQGSDAALVQDALADAREHLSLALQAAREKDPTADEARALAGIIEAYGSPEETAAAYREVERRTAPALERPLKTRSAFGRFLEVYTDPRAWGGLFYMLIASLTGVFYFSWAVTGFAVSVSFLILMIGLPVALLFLLSIRGLALLEGRLVEALLGVRMPRRPLFSNPNLRWLDRLQALVTDRTTWRMLGYMVAQFVSGIVYLVLLTVVLAFTLSLLGLPIIQQLTGQGVIVMGTTRYTVPLWSYPLWMLGGALLWTIFMNVARGIGQLHGRYARWMLIA